MYSLVSNGKMLQYDAEKNNNKVAFKHITKQVMHHHKFVKL